MPIEKRIVLLIMHSFTSEPPSPEVAHCLYWTVYAEGKFCGFMSHLRGPLWKRYCPFQKTWFSVGTGNALKLRLSPMCAKTELRML